MEEIKPHQKQLTETHFLGKQTLELQIESSKSSKHHIARGPMHANRKSQQQMIQSDIPVVNPEHTLRQIVSDIDPQSIVGSSGEFAAVEYPSTLIDTVSVTLERPNTAIHSLSSYPLSEKAKQCQIQATSFAALYHIL